MIQLRKTPIAPRGVLTREITPVLLGDPTLREHCPLCDRLGILSTTPEQAREIAPEYMAALAAAPGGPVPDEPAALCWDCRRVVARNV